MKIERAPAPDARRVRSPRAKIVLLLTLLSLHPLCQMVEGEDLSVGDWLEMGNSQATRGEYEEAIVSYDRALGLDAYNPDLWYNKGLALSGLGRYEEALRCYHRASNLEPFDSEVWLGTGASLSSLGRYEEALDSYNRAVEFDSENADAWNNRGTVLARLGRSEEAIDSYDRALELEPGDADAWNNRGTILARLGRHQEALDSYDRTIELRPENADAWNNRGSALHQLGRYQDALDSYNRAISFDPFHEYAWHNKGLLVPTLDEDTREAFALSRDRIYVEAEIKTAPSLVSQDAAVGDESKSETENEKLPGWRVLLVMAAILAAGLLLNLGGKGKALFPKILQSSLSRLVIFGDRSLKRR